MKNNIVPMILEMADTSNEQLPRMGDWAWSVRTKEFRYTYYPNNNGEQSIDIRN